LRHGFKAETERKAAAARKRLGVSDHVPFDAWAYCKLLGVELFDIKDMGLAASAMKQLTVVDTVRDLANLLFGAGPGVAR
jgi:hypothetical protein